MWRIGFLFLLAAAVAAAIPGFNEAQAVVEFGGLAIGMPLMIVGLHEAIDPRKR